VKLKDYMDRNGINYELRDIRSNPAWAQELANNTGKQGVPYVVVDGEWRRGYEPGRPYSDEFAKKLLNA
jgi:glutaredoxin